jgi:surfeit locus 1 family protein
MRLRSILLAVVVIAAASVCVRLGFWQISRLHEKQALNAALRAAQQSPPIVVGDRPPPLARARHRALQVTGRFDEAHQFLLSGRALGGEPGVEVVTPLVLPAGGGAVLVNRGWLPSPDASTARPQDAPEPGERTVRGLVEELRHGAGGPFVRTLERDSVTVWSARWLDADSISSRLPYPVAGYALRELPGPGVPERPHRSPPRPYDEMLHVSYAAQWFLFAAIIAGGPIVLARSRRRRGAAQGGPIDVPPDTERSS